MLTTPFCSLLGVEHPIFGAPMGGGMAGPELVAALANHGSFAFLGTVGLPPPAVGPLIRRTRELTDRPFGVNVVIPNLQGGEIETILDEGVAVLGTFWGDPSPYVADAHARGIKVIPQVGSVEEAVAMDEAGVDAVIAQGVEAGGHVRGTTPLAELLSPVVAAVKPLPVIAAGGIADGERIAVALLAGAQAASLGTRFLASDEANADRRYKERIVRATAEDTCLTKLFDIGWPDAAHRVLRNRAVLEWEEAGQPPPGRRPGEGTIVARMPVAGQWIDAPRYSVFPAMPGFEGDMELLCLYAGESCSRIHDIRPAAAILASLVRDTEAALGEARPPTA